MENLIKKHEAFEKAAAAQEERFAALERLTTVRYFFFTFFQTVKIFQKQKNFKALCQRKMKIWRSYIE